MRRFVIWGLALAVGYVVIKSLPDVARYLKIREM
jgi:uncharacterized protein DUF6893